MGLGRGRPCSALLAWPPRPLGLLQAWGQPWMSSLVGTCRVPVSGGMAVCPGQGRSTGEPRDCREGVEGKVNSEQGEKELPGEGGKSAQGKERPLGGGPEKLAGLWRTGWPDPAPCPGPWSSWRRGLQVVTVDMRNKKVVFKDGFKMEYSKLLLAPGSRWEGISLTPFTLDRTSARTGGVGVPGAPH